MDNSEIREAPEKSVPIRLEGVVIKFLFRKSLMLDEKLKSTLKDAVGKLR